MDVGGTSSEATPGMPHDTNDEGETSANLMERLRVESPSPEVTSATLNEVQGVHRPVRFLDIDAIESPERVQNPATSPQISERLIDPENGRRLEVQRARLIEEIHFLEEQQSNLRALHDSPASLLPRCWDDYNEVLLLNTDHAAVV